MALHVAVALLMAPQTECCLEGSVAKLTHVLPLERQRGQRRCVVEECVRLVRAARILHAVGPGQRAMATSFHSRPVGLARR